MLFNAVEFWIFLPTVFVAYWSLVGLTATRSYGLTARNTFLLVVSFVFYGWWDWRFLALLVASSVADFTLARVIDSRVDPFSRKALLGLSLAMNLGLLGTFKYYDFFVASFEQALFGLGIDAELARLGWVLPVGISFYTFQALSYTIDVYHRQLPASRSLIDFCAYVAFFPQLVAGPIERATSLMPQFASIRPFDAALARDGGRQILWGMFKKIVIADSCARVVNETFADHGSRSGLELTLAAVFFSFQIYGDFSGYSDIAIGTAKLFGFRLMTNFRVPYFARDIAEFWRRWHISLTTWFRDYLYVPLGGSRGSRGLIVRNVLVVFLISGLWHGANWTFIAWGALNGLLFVPLLMRGANRRFLDTVAAGASWPKFGELGRMLTTFALVTVGWVFFRSASIGNAVDYLFAIATPARWAFAPDDVTLKWWLTILGTIAVMLWVEWLHRERHHGLDIGERPLWLRWMVYQLLVVLFFLFGTFGDDDFIYFQF